MRARNPRTEPGNPGAIPGRERNTGAVLVEDPGLFGHVFVPKFFTYSWAFGLSEEMS